MNTESQEEDEDQQPGGEEHVQRLRGMGFPNMKYLDPDVHGAPVANQTMYKEFQEVDNDIKNQREGFI